jgi:hypothetical protein
VTARSGKKAWGPWRRPWPPCLRHTVVAWAAEAIRPAFWAQGSDQQPRDQGQAPQAAGRALAFTWRRLLSRGWQERPPDAEAVALQALPPRGSSLLHPRAKASGKTVPKP